MVPWSLVVAVVLAGVVGALADDSCPPKDQISPCTCDGEGMSCLGNVNVQAIRKAFAATFKFGGVRGLWVQGTPLTEIPGDLFGNIKVQEAYIEMTNATKVDLTCLQGSKTTLWVLSLFGNKLTTFDYANLGIYQTLTTLNLGGNELTTIPDNAFKSNFLRNLILARNKIETIGRYAFAGLPNLQGLQLLQNNIKTLGPNSMTIRSQVFQIGLAYNQISSVSNTAFDETTPQLVQLTVNQLTSLKYEAFGNLVTRMGRIQGVIDVTANPFSCRGCDYTWLVDNKLRLVNLLPGFRCTNGASLLQLTRTSIGC